MLNWTRRITANGVIFYPPEGRAAGIVSVVQRQRPLLRLRDIRAEHVRRMTTPDGPPTITPPERLLTDERETAFLYELTSRAGGDTVMMSVGVIYGDDFFAPVVAIGSVPEMFDALRGGVRFITQSMPLGLGAYRRRRFEYDSPPGWQALDKPHSVSWYHPDFPKNRSVIRVYDAKPNVASTPTLLDKRLFEDPQNDLHSVLDATVFECTTDTGITGAYELTRGTSTDGVESVIARVFLIDSHFAYTLRMEVSEPHVKETSSIFEAAVRSVKPLEVPPKAIEAKVESTDALIHWAG